jgi:hypothetical protein
MNENYENNFVEETVADEVYDVADCNEIMAESDEADSNLAATLGKGLIFIGGAVVGAAACKVAKPAKEFVCEKVAEIKEEAAIKKAEKAARKADKKARKDAKKAEKKETVIEGTAKEVTEKTDKK